MARSEVGTIVRGMGMGMKVLELLLGEIKKQDGNEELLALLTRPRFQNNLQKIVETMINCDWRIPASEMRKLAEEYYRKEFEVDEDLVEEVRNLWWYSPLIDLGIPFKRFSRSDIDQDYPPIPSDILKELHGKKMEYPLMVRRGTYVVVDWAYDEHDLKPGDAIDAKKVRYVYIAEAWYFNFDK